MPHTNGAVRQEKTRVYLCRANGFGLRENKVHALERLLSKGFPSVEVSILQCAHTQVHDMTLGEISRLAQLRDDSERAAASLGSILENRFGDCAEPQFALLDFTKKLFRIILSSQNAIPWLKSAHLPALSEVKNRHGLELESIPCVAIGASSARGLSADGFTSVQTLDSLRESIKKPSPDVLYPSALAELLHLYCLQCREESCAFLRQSFPNRRIRIESPRKSRPTAACMGWAVSDPKQALVFHALYPCGDNSILNSMYPRFCDEKDTAQNTNRALCIDRWSSTVRIAGAKVTESIEFAVLLHQVTAYGVTYDLANDIRSEFNHEMERIVRALQDGVAEKESTVFVLYTPRIAEVVLRCLGYTAFQTFNSTSSNIQEEEIGGNRVSYKDLKEHHLICMGKTTALLVKTKFGIDDIPIVEDHTDLHALSRSIADLFEV